MMIRNDFFDVLTKIFAVIEDEENTVDDLLMILEFTSLIIAEFSEGFRADRENAVALTVPIIELVRVKEYLADAKVSTQHGVKGESHESVVFITDNCMSIPIVHMYRFFEI